MQLLQPLSCNVTVQARTVSCSSVLQLQLLNISLCFRASKQHQCKAVGTLCNSVPHECNECSVSVPNEAVPGILSVNICMHNIVSSKSYCHEAAAAITCVLFCCWLTQQQLATPAMLACSSRLRLQWQTSV
jgi:hypothetical protein